jgi:glycosyltransferase involved in cell wall biosynthesis
MKIVLIGNFKKNINGQSIRTKNVLQLLEENGYIVNKFDSASKIKFIVSAPKLLYSIFISEGVIVLLGRNGIIYLLPLLSIIAKIFKKQIILIAIGGWLDNLIESSYCARFFVRMCNHVLPQTKRLQESLKTKLKKSNIVYFPNFRINNNKEFSAREHVCKNISEFRVVFHARVSKEKGVPLLFKLAEKIEAEEIKDVTIDLYGPIQDDYRNEFFESLKKIKIVNYCGIVDSTKINSILAQYNLSILPTCYFGEGFPGSILDAYNSRVPVLTTRWLDIPDYVLEGKTGFLCEPNSIDSLSKVFFEIYENRIELIEMENSILEYSRQFNASNAYSIINSILPRKH